MFALLVSIDFEGSDLLGIYSSMDRALEQAQRYKEKHRIWDELSICEIPVDADAIEATMHQTAIWSIRS